MKKVHPSYHFPGPKPEPLPASLRKTKQARRQESCFNSTLERHQGEVDDLTRSLEHVEAQHIVAQNESKKQIR
jgi:hypothetical protein